MPDKLATEPYIKEGAAIVAALVIGYVARTLTSDEKFDLKNFLGEMILSAMMGAAIYLLGFIQEVGFAQTMVVALFSGMGATRSFEWLAKMFKSLPKSGD